MPAPTCARCGQPIRPDQESWNPAMMDGPVHKACPEAGGSEGSAGRGARGRRGGGRPDRGGSGGEAGDRGAAGGGGGGLILPD